MRRVLVLAAVGALALSGSASARVISSAVDAGSVPQPTAGAVVVTPTSPPIVEVNAAPRAPVSLRVQVDCYRGARTKSASRSFHPSQSPIRRRIKWTLRHADSCDIYASANFTDFATGGRIAVKIRSHTG